MTGSVILELTAMMFSICAFMWGIHIGGTASDRDLDSLGVLVAMALAAWIVFIAWKVFT